ncbi:DUF6165 family protein [Bacteroidota bacterium]
MKIEISTGELVDKITILELKLKNIKNDKEKIKNVKNEFDILTKSLNETNITSDSELYKKLFEVNQKLWIIEDEIRIKEKNKEFDEEFIELARSVYFTNDVRAKLKREIDVSTGSNIINEKSYEDYE